MARYLTRLLGAALVLVIMTPGVDARDAADELFGSGVEAFREERYEDALEHFRRARARGLDSPALHYNMGVSYYRLGRLEPAAAAFRRATRFDETRALAYYNLGRIAQRRDDVPAARRWFRRSRKLAETDELRTLSERRLAELAPSPAPPPASRALLELSSGYDSNVLLANDTEVALANAADPFAEADAYADRVLTGDRDAGLRAQGRVVTRRHFELEDFNFTDAGAGLRFARPLGSWQTEVGADASVVTFGGNRFETVGELIGRAERPLPAGRRLSLRLSSAWIDGGSQFDFLDGTRRGLALRLRSPQSSPRWDVGYELEINDRDDLSRSGDFFSFSPMHHVFSASGTWSLGRAYSLTAEAGYRLSRFADPEQRAATGLEKRRFDQRPELRVDLRRRFAQDWVIELGVLHQRNDSNLRQFDYERTVVDLSVSRSFSFR